MPGSGFFEKRARVELIRCGAPGVRIGRGKRHLKVAPSTPRGVLRAPEEGPSGDAHRGGLP